MIENLPLHVSLFFGLTTIATLLFFYWVLKSSASEKTCKKAILIFFVLLIWLIIQAALTLKNVYNSSTLSAPLKILLFGILPAICTIIFLFVTGIGRQFIDSLSITYITYLNAIRIPVELVLLSLFLNKAVPQLMTFEGRNFDILSGISTPLIAYFGLTKGKLNTQIILVWNFVCLALLLKHRGERDVINTIANSKVCI